MRLTSWYALSETYLLSENKNRTGRFLAVSTKNIFESGFLDASPKS